MPLDSLWYCVYFGLIGVLLKRCVYVPDLSFANAAHAPGSTLFVQTRL